MCHEDVKTCLQKLLGALMIIFSPITIALGIVDLVLTDQIWCAGPGPCMLTNATALTWVAVAIWAPIPIFFNGIGAVWIASRPYANKGWLCLLSFMNTIAFGPAIIVITALEVSSKFPDGLEKFLRMYLAMVPLDKMKSAQDNITAVFGIEIVICLVGFVLWLHALAVFYLNCCCGTCMAEMTTPVDVSNQPAMLSPANGNPQEAERMNMWSAYRWMNNGGAPAAAPVAPKTSVYAVGASPSRFMNMSPGSYCHGPSSYNSPYQMRGGNTGW